MVGGPTRLRLLRFARNDGGSYARDFTIFCRCLPSPAVLSSTTSPTCRNFGSGFMPSATPGGVPVMMTSPGSSTMNCEQYQTICSQSKIIVLVEPFCRVSPFTVSSMSRCCGSLTSSLVTSQGPIGPKVSQPLPLVHWPPRSIWKSSLVELFGVIVLSFGPQMLEGALLKMIGSLGIGMPVSAAWSE